MPYKPDYKYLPPINWSILTPFYDFLCAISGLGTRFKRQVLNSAVIKDGMTVADIGCGTGVFLKIAKQQYPKAKFIGIDPDQVALAIAERRLAKAELEVELKEAFAESLPIQDHSVDICFSTLAFHHLPDEIKLKAIQEMHRVLKPNGIAIIADFGQSKSLFFRKMLFFEKLEYLEGNLKGLIPQYFKSTGFQQPRIAGRHFPGIKIITAQK